MYKIENTIKDQPISDLTVEKLITSDHLDILSISLEKGKVFPEHTSPRNAFLIMLEGEIQFHIKNKVYTLTDKQHFQFEKEVPHWVEAIENSKFLIVR